MVHMENWGRVQVKVISLTSLIKERRVEIQRCSYVPVSAQADCIAMGLPDKLQERPLLTEQEEV